MKAAVTLLALQIIEVYLPHTLGTRRDSDDAARSTLSEEIQEHVRQEERGQVVDGQGSLDTVRSLGAALQDQAGVVDEHVEPVVPFPELSRQPPNLGLNREVRE